MKNGYCKKNLGNNLNDMIIKFIHEKIFASRGINLTDFISQQENYIYKIQGEIKRIFSPVRVDQDGFEHIHAKRYGDKLITIKYYEENGSDIGEIIHLENGLILLLKLRVAEDDSEITETKEYVKDGKVRYKRNPGDKGETYGDHYLGIYLANGFQKDEKNRNISGTVFYTQKGKNSIKLPIKGLLQEILFTKQLIFEPSSTKKKIANIQGVLSKVVFKGDYSAKEVCPSIVDKHINNTVRIGLNVSYSIKGINKRFHIRELMPGYSKQVFKELVENQPYGISFTDISAEIDGETYSNITTEEEELIGILQSYKEISPSDYNFEYFKQLCENFFK